MNDLLIPIAAATGIIAGGIGLIVGKLGNASLRGELEYWLTLNREQGRRMAELIAENQALAKEARYPKALRDYNEKRKAKAASDRAERMARAAQRVGVEA